jgi:O-antigen ligase
VKAFPIEPPVRVRVTGIGLLAFACGATALWRFNLIGDVYAAELGLPIVALAALAAGGARAARDRRFWLLVAAALVTLAGYVLSDLIRATPELRYLRGWGRMALVITDFVCLAILLAHDRRSLWWFVLGAGVGGVAYLRLVEGLPLSSWKFGYGEPMAFAGAALACFAPPRIASLGFVLLGALSINYETRTLAAACFAIAALLWVRAPRPGAPLARGGRALRIALVGAIAFALTAAALELTDSDWSAQRRESSNVARVAAFEVGVTAIAASPLVGYGSWSEDRALADLQRRLYYERRGLPAPPPGSGSEYFNPHSQLLQAWVEAGVLGVAFFALLGWFALGALRRTALVRPLDALTPILLFVLIMGLWHIAMSPFSAPHRIGIALTAVAVLAAGAPRRRAMRERPPRSIAAARTVRA